MRNLQQNLSSILHYLALFCTKFSSLQHGWANSSPNLVPCLATWCSNQKFACLSSILHARPFSSIVQISSSKTKQHYRKPCRKPNLSLLKYVQWIQHTQRVQYCPSWHQNWLAEPMHHAIRGLGYPHSLLWNQWTKTLCLSRKGAAHWEEGRSLASKGQAINLC